jgi:hypothetical protein
MSNHFLQESKFEVTSYIRWMWFNGTVSIASDAVTSCRTLQIWATTEDY